MRHRRCGRPSTSTVRPTRSTRPGLTRNGPAALEAGGFGIAGTSIASLIETAPGRAPPVRRRYPARARRRKFALEHRRNDPALELVGPGPSILVVQRHLGRSPRRKRARRLNAHPAPRLRPGADVHAGDFEPVEVGSSRSSGGSSLRSDFGGRGAARPAQRRPRSLLRSRGDHCSATSS
jgi:hypothetical protein